MLLLLLTLALGQPPKAPACTAPEYRQFDFWIGDWDVTLPDGTTAGRNTIAKALDGCALHERWVGARGVRGESFNTWDAGRRRWHQTWVDSAGTLLLLDGAFDGKRMVLEGETPAAGGAAVRQRITWEALGPDQVRQRWESSRDNGATWSVVFDGTYRRRK